MALLSFPVPDLERTLKEASRVLQLTLEPELYLQYCSALKEQEGLLQDIHSRFATQVVGKENWVTEQFKTRLLSLPDPLPTSTAIPALLSSSAAQQCPERRDRVQVDRAAALLWAVAKLRSEPWLVEGGALTERTQQSEVFSASRLPGETRDEIKVYPQSLHAVLFHAGAVFPVNILSRSVEGGSLSPLPLPEIHRQVSEVLRHADLDRSAQVPICSFSGLQRRVWYALRRTLLEQGGSAVAQVMEVLESAVVALVLEDGHPPPDPADALNALKLGKGSEGGHYFRYYDKVVNMVVFKDGTAGMVFEHSAVDGMVAGIVAEGVWHLSEALKLDGLDLQSGTPETPPVKPLIFSLRDEHHPDIPSSPEPVHKIVTFEISSYPDVFSTLRGQRGVYDAWVNFSLQLALKQTCGEDAFLLVTPTHMRHYKHGRCDPTYTMTKQSRELVRALLSSVQYSPEELYSLFHQAFKLHKELIKATKSGQGIGPHLSILRNSLPQGSRLKQFLEPFGCPSVYLTGKDLVVGVECGVGNVYATDQLAVSYMGRRDRVRMVLSGKGTFVECLESLQKNLNGALMLVKGLALRYAITEQMGAVESLLGSFQKMGRVDSSEDKKKGGDINQNFNLPGQSLIEEVYPSGTTPKLVQNGTLIIHGGAGEEMMLKQEVVEVIEFSLRAAASLGAQVLSSGGSSLDAVEKCVAALEDCFLFNAGKGSVYNQDGEQEMEATIIEGCGKRSGSVACLRTIKNPVKVARLVMEKSPHALLSGGGVESFLETLKEKAVDLDYFHTDLRWMELQAKRSGLTTRPSHPQTVGAIALDRWGKLAAATSTGGLVGKWKGRIGDTAVVGAGIYAGENVAVTCSGDGDVFLRNTVASKVAHMYNLKGYSLREACKEVLRESLEGSCGGIIAVSSKGEAVVETNAAVMFVGSVKGDVTRAEVLRPKKTYLNVIWESEDLVAYLHPNPWTPGTTILTSKSPSWQSSIFHLPLPEYTALMLGARAVAGLLCQQMPVHRCALMAEAQADQPAHVKLLPLHGLEPEWKPHLHEEKEFHPQYRGYCTSKNGPRATDADLEEVQARIQAKLRSPIPTPSYHFFGDSADDNLFSRIVQGVEKKQWRVWEDDAHVAFLTPFPNSPGFTVLAPRRHLPSDLFSLDEEDYIELALAARTVALLLEEGLGAQSCALIFEGLEIDYAHAKLVPLIMPSQGPEAPEPHFCPIYTGHVSSVDGPPANPQDLKDLQAKITQSRPPRSWENPREHAISAIKSQWYRNLFQIQNTLYHATVEFFHNTCRYAYALTPITTDTISSPMGLGSDSEPVRVNLLGQDIYLADSMQFVLEYFLRFQEGLPGTYYVSPSFRGEDPDATHLNQFYHVECELLGDMEKAIGVAEAYVAYLTRSMLRRHADLILKTAGTLSHAESLLEKLSGLKGFPRVTLDQALTMMPSEECLEWVVEGQPQFGRKLTRKGERVLIEKFGGAVWLTEMDHLGVPFYQAYVDGTNKQKAKAADLLLGLGETLGLGERHSTAEKVQEALMHHTVSEDAYTWYINMRRVKPLLTSGWGMGTERYLCWLLQHNDVRDLHIIPRMKSKKYLP
nr:PREDICTED: uncharacterized protein LOC102687500 isoform X4 [Lepisosteus oculatus]XP_015215085.1 PREDICTED: uncharacterized protein LOC102687500 isoform X4 [Lepisosteus oculatus]